MTLRTCLGAILLLLPVAALAAEPTAPQIDSVRIGFEGHFRVGFWTPVEVDITGGDAQSDATVELVLPDGDGVAGVVTAPQSVALAPAEHRRVLFYAKFGRPSAAVTVRVRTADRLLAERAFAPPEIPTAMLATQGLILAVGPAADVPAALSLRRQDELSRIEVVQLKNTDSLPDRWIGYEGVDTLVITTSRDDYRKLNQVQLGALAHWIRLGGRLVWCAAKNAKAALAEDSPLYRFAPGTFEEMVSIRTAPLESYVITSDRLDAVVGGPAERFRLEAPRLTHVRGRIEAYDGNRATDIPLVVRESRGLGEIVFAGVDLDLSPVARWTARGRLINQLLGVGEEASAEEAETSSRQGLHAGFDDLSGQLRGTLDQFGRAPLIPFWVVGALITLYLIAIGPLDYFLVKNVLKRMELTWITFPLWILGFCALAYWAAENYKGHETRVNQIDLVDIDEATGLVRGTTWFNIFSPDDSSYDLKVNPAAIVPESASKTNDVTSWFGLPGTGLGGMNSETAAPPAEASPYRFSPPLDSLSGVPIRVWSTKPLIARWDGTVDTGSSWIMGANLTRDENNTLQGTLVNRLRRTPNSTKPDMPLEDCTLYYGRLAFAIGRWEPSAEVSVIERPARTIEAVVTRRHPQGDKDVATPYDPYDLDAKRVLELMTLHDAVGGRKYTHLLNRYQDWVDMSDILRGGRAVLVGRFAEPMATINRDDRPMGGPDDRRWTMFRFVFPVTDVESKK